MSHPDSNNPYGGPPPGQQPAQPYDYPQGQRQPQPYGYPQPGQQPYGFPPQHQPQVQPQGQGHPGYPGHPGYAGGAYIPTELPGLAKAARVLLFVIGGLQLIGGIAAAVGLTALNSADTGLGSGPAGDAAAGIGMVAVVVLLALAVLVIVLAAKFGSGGNGVRVTTIVYASLGIVGSLFNLVQGTPAGAIGAVIGIAVGAVILAAMLQSQTAAWFKRPRH
ncbi:hypothetical protein [Streptomyces meridianus]|uniref:Integral membrane protein n=1 Tax=Streptomyces meridianus TaxID=2938945 RepID=A0ABT0X629_9ACTN|nr:hypothetical protein [Streptomyces meridianus]MCM2577981.1 hypothetical protein [Streptomyces meridianus]